MSVKTVAERALDQGQGILRLAPTWVPRTVCVPGRRLKLHPDDYYALGGERGGLDERWFASCTNTDNGPLTGEHEGLSFVVVEEGERTDRILLRDAVAELAAHLIGERIWREHAGFPVFAKLFDNMGPIPFHIHQQEKHAARVGLASKPEAYFFPAQVNNHPGNFPYTFFGFAPGTTRAQVREALEHFTSSDNHITALSTAYQLELGTAWNVPAGVLHGPGTLCTYEPQKASDVFALYQSMVDGQVTPVTSLWHNVPEEEIGNFDYLLDMLDWEGNLDPDFREKSLMRPRLAQGSPEEGFVENWICYLSDEFSASELTVLPGRTVTVRNDGAYGLILLQGHGRMGAWDVDTPTLIRFGELTSDEFFVSESAARAGVKIENRSSTEPLVMLKHFGPGVLR